MELGSHITHLRERYIAPPVHTHLPNINGYNTTYYFHIVYGGQTPHTPTIINTKLPILCKVGSLHMHCCLV